MTLEELEIDKKFLQRVDEWREKEFRRIGDSLYLDHAGATLYSETQLRMGFELLSSNIYGNPHSGNPSSTLSHSSVDAARSAVSELFNAPVAEYSVVFTSGATAGLRILGSAFPFEKNSVFEYTTSSHTSVVGIRALAMQAGASFRVFDEEDLRKQVETGVYDSIASGPSLLAYPAECNLTGRKFPSDWCREIKKQRNAKGQDWYTVLDAAKYAATSPLDIAASGADFVVVSFYKLCGWPDGLGALIMRKDAAKILQKRYFGGGTVSALVSQIPVQHLRTDLSARWEDGTLPFASIASLVPSLQWIREVGMTNIERHVYTLAQYAYRRMRSLRHHNGVEVAMFYGNHHMETITSQGGIVAFNLRRSDGSVVGYAEVDRLASLNNVHIRTGCMCNPGACHKFLGLSPEDVLAHHKMGHSCWDAMDVIDGVPTGMCRISFGYMSTFSDVYRWIEFVEKYFVERESVPAVGSLTSDEAPLTLSQIVYYPIKSCAGVSVSEWQIGESGLLFDREWSIIDDTGAALSQKKEPRLCLIQPSLDFVSQQLRVHSSQMDRDLIIELSETGHSSGIARVRGSERTGTVYGDEVRLWFTECLGRACTLIRKSQPTIYPFHGPVRSLMASEQKQGKAKSDDLQCKTGSFANTGEFLVVLEQSVVDLNKRLLENQSPLTVTVDRFRANLVLSGGSSSLEDKMGVLRIGDQKLEIDGPCSRCEMVCIDQATANKGVEPLRTLAAYRRSQGRILFGSLFSHVKESSGVLGVLRVGTPVVVMTIE